MNTSEMTKEANHDTQTKKVLYTAKAHTTGGREGGASRTSDGRLDVKFSLPGGPGNGTNPEQLFRVGAVAGSARNGEFDVETAIGSAGGAAFPAACGVGFGGVQHFLDLIHSAFLGQFSRIHIWISSGLVAGDTWLDW